MLGDLIFLAIAILVVLSAIGVVVSSSLIYSAVSLLFTLFGVAGLYIFLYADFLAITQVIVYVGGILVLIIFGVMLTNKIDQPSIASSSINQVFGAILAIVLFTFQLGVIFTTEWNIAENFTSSNFVNENTIKTIGKMLLEEYLLPFEIVSVLLLGALIGSAMLSRKSQ